MLLASLLGVGMPCLAAQAAEPSRLVASGARAALACPAGDVQVLGSGNTVSVDGRCSSLEVTGSDNTVTIELGTPGGRATIDGDRNRVAFTGPRAPEAVTHGAYNIVLPAHAEAVTPAAAGAASVVVAPIDAGPLLLGPRSPAFDVSCRDRDVVISGEGQSYTLRDGCRSVTVHGGLNTITAELLPGAPIAVGAAGVILNYVLVADGPAPVVRVTARGLRAKQIQHYGTGSLELATGR